LGKIGRWKGWDDDGWNFHNVTDFIDTPIDVQKLKSHTFDIQNVLVMMIRDASYYNDMISSLKEREKEIKCLYRVQDIMNEDLSVDEFLMEVVKRIWGGWQYPMITRVKITFEGQVYKEPGWEETEWVQSADIIIDDKVCGKIEVFYIRFKKLIRGSQFLPEEQKLLNTIAAKVSSYIFNKRLLKSLELLEKGGESDQELREDYSGLLPLESDVHYLWRWKMVEKMADKLDLGRYGVEGFYIIGSVKNATAGPASDIDILIHFRGDESQERALRAWFEGWGYGLSELNLLKTGYPTEGLVDLHIVTDQDIENRDSYACMIGAVDDGARLIRKRSDG
jgi:hypothetical protein